MAGRFVDALSMWPARTYNDGSLRRPEQASTPSGAAVLPRASWPGICLVAPAAAGLLARLGGPDLLLFLRAVQAWCWLSFSYMAWETRSSSGTWYMVLWRWRASFGGWVILLPCTFQPTLYTFAARLDDDDLFCAPFFRWLRLFFMPAL